MKCVEFEHYLEFMTPVSGQGFAAPQVLIEHAASCLGCARRLRDEQLLSWSLAEIAGQLRDVTPSRGIHRRVMEAFDREREAGQRHHRKWLGYAAAIAAGLLLTAAGSFALWRRQPEPAAKIRTAFDLSAAVARIEIGEKMQPVITQSTPHQKTSRSDRNMISHDAKRAEAPPEIATEFFRLNYATPIEPGAQIVRVQLPRSAMTQFGLPVNMDRADQPVKADVIMGIDGVAQAIRFVQ